MREAVARLEAMEATTNPGQRRIQLLAEIMRLRRACCHPRLALADSRLPSSKLDAFADIVDELLENRHKALVFSQFVSMLHLIRAELDALLGLAESGLDTIVSGQAQLLAEPPSARPAR